jgi:hypothetical protein
MKILTRKGFPGSSSATVEQESIVHFIQALDDRELKFYVQQSRQENMHNGIIVTLESQLFLQEKTRQKIFSRGVIVCQRSLQEFTRIRYL